MCPGGVKSMLGPGGGVKAECLLEKMCRWDPEGEGVGSASLNQARTPQTRCLVGVSFSRWREGFQHWMDLREMQVYQFMSNIIKQVLNAKGEAQDREGGAPGSPRKSEVV